MPNPRFSQFGLKAPFVLMAAMTAGGQTARCIVMSEAPTRGGVAMSWSAPSEAIVFAIGCDAALAGMAIVWFAPKVFRIRAPWRRNGPVGAVVFLAAAVAIGSISAGAAIFALAWLFFALPRVF